MTLLDGRYGPYVTDGTTNASLPKGTDAPTLTLAEAVELLEAREGAPKKRTMRGAARESARPRVTRPATRSTVPGAGARRLSLTVIVST